MKIKTNTYTAYTVFDTSRNSFLEIKIHLNQVGLKHLRGKQKLHFPSACRSDSAMLIPNKMFWPQPLQIFHTFYITVFRSEAFRDCPVCAISAARANIAHCTTGEDPSHDYTWSCRSWKRQAENKQGAKHPHLAWYSIKHHTTVSNLSDYFPELSANFPLSTSQR